MRTLLIAAALALALPAAADERQVIPGADKMTPAERDAYRASQLQGDPVRGANVHTACFSCHGMERYTQKVTQFAATFVDSLLRASGFDDMPPPARFRGRIDSLAKLRMAVVSRNDYLNPKLTDQEVEDVVAYLNATYYKFPSK